jgi:hypothetical protein
MIFYERLVTEYILIPEKGGVIFWRGAAKPRPKNFLEGF